MINDSIKDLPELDLNEVKKRVKKRFDDKPIGKRLYQSYIWMAAIIVLVAAAAILTNIDASGRLKNFKNVQMEIVDEAWSARQMLVDVEKKAYQIFMTADDQQSSQYADELQAEMESLSSAIGSMKELVKKDDKIDAVLLDKLEQAVNATKPYQEQALESSRNGRTKEAFETISSQCTPLVEEANNYLVELTGQAKDRAQNYITYSTIRLWVLIGFIILAAVFTVFNMLRLAKRIVKGITDPLIELEQAVQQLEEGNLDFELAYKSGNEIGHLADMVRRMADELRRYIANIDDTLGRMARKDFTVTVDLDYKGSFRNIKVSLEQIIEVLNGITSAIKTAAENVSDGSSQIADASQALAEGAADQSGSVEELLAAVQDISERVERNADDIANVSTRSVQAQDAVDEGNAQMNDLMNAMEDIQQSSEQISEIISVIEGISGQTNMLALNASIEAARAGEHGKGFAVVAGEIGQLSGETKDATKNTTELIHRSLAAVERGVELAKKTAEALEGIVESTGQIKILAGQVSETSAAQAESLSQIGVVVQSISDVAQTNAAVAQEAAASSSELTNHAARLAGTLEEFNLKEL